MRNKQQLGIEATNFLVIGLQLEEECSLLNLWNTKFGNLFFIPRHVIYKTGFYFFNFWCGVEVFPGIAANNGDVQQFSKIRGKTWIF
jgi:hypothetical protein